MDIVIATLLQWLLLNKDIQMTVPSVYILPDKHLHHIANAPVYALYDVEDGYILLSHSIDVNTVRGKSIILHELIHHYQNISGLTPNYHCPNEAELLAYTTQREYIIDKGGKLMPELGKFNIVMRSLCEGGGY